MKDIIPKKQNYIKVSHEFFQTKNHQIGGLIFDYFLYYLLTQFANVCEIKEVSDCVNALIGTT